MPYSPVATFVAKSEIIVMVNSGQEVNKVLVDSEGFFGRVCDAMGVANAYGVKKKIAKLLRLSPTAIGFWEQGQVPGLNSLQSLVKISELTNTSIHWLLTGKGNKYVGKSKSATEAESELSSGDESGKSGERKSSSSEIFSVNEVALMDMMREVVWEEIERWVEKEKSGIEQDNHYPRPIIAAKTEDTKRRKGRKGGTK